ncbi:MAG: hypothetical protein HY699_20895 [Deltaproteobacteria bacterium]|nr:hypothetical protein [Deltaproteobacteria bacterium]
MLRRFRWLLMAIGLLALGSGGASIFSRPAHEVLYSPRPPLRTCLSSGCLAIYIIEVGNTGSEGQEDVRIRLRADVVRAALLPVTVRNFGKVDRPVTVSEAGGVRTFAFGRVKPGDRVELSFTLRHGERFQAPGWEQILVAVEAAQGPAQPGDPAAVALGRMLYAVFGQGWW